MRIGVMPDMHAPAADPKFVAWARKLFEKNRVEKVIYIGDVVDFHTLSRWPKSVKSVGVDEEVERSIKQMKSWGMGDMVCIGNHDERMYDRMNDSMIPTRARKSYNDLLDSDWEWKHEFVIDGVLYTHGHTVGGQDPARNLSNRMGCSVVVGHHHTVAGISHLKTMIGRRFCMNVGVGFDFSHPYLDYARRNTFQPIQGCGVVIDGDGQHFRRPA